MKKDLLTPIILLVFIPVILWLISIYIFSNQYIDQSVSNLGRIANWGSFTLRNDAQYKKSHTAKELSFIPLATKKAFNSYAIKFPVSFYVFFNDEKAIRVRSPLSEMRTLPAELDWSDFKSIDGDSIAFFTSETPEGTTLIVVKCVLEQSASRKIELIMSQELNEYDDFFATFSTISFFFFAVLFGVIGVIFKMTSGDLIKQVTQLDFAVIYLGHHGKGKVEALTSSRFAPIRNLSQTILNYVETNERLTSRLSSTGTVLLGQSEGLNQIIKQQSSSFTDYTATISEVTASTTQIAASSESIAELTRQIEQLAVENKTKIDSAIGEINDMALKMDKIEIQANRFRELLEQNTAQIEEIASISAIIQKINEELKLISFNAQIEAVSGKNQAQRFKVVANEVRELANTVEKSVYQIKSQTEKIIENSKESHVMYREVSKLVSEGSTRLHQINHSISSFSDRATENLMSAKQISRSTTEQMSAIAQIVSSMNHMNNQTVVLYKQVETLSEKAASLKDSGRVLNNMLVELKGLN